MAVAQIPLRGVPGRAFARTATRPTHSTFGFSPAPGVGRLDDAIPVSSCPTRTTRIEALLANTYLRVAFRLFRDNENRAAPQPVGTPG